MKLAAMIALAAAGCAGAAPPHGTDAKAHSPLEDAGLAQPAPVAAHAPTHHPGAQSRAALQKKTLLAKADAVNRGDMTAYADAYAPDARTFELTIAGFAEAARGREAIAKEQSETASKFDVRFELGRALLGEGFGVIEWRASGKDREQGRPVTIRGAQVVRFADDGRISTETSYTDQLSIAVQLGIARGRTRAAPSPGSTEWRFADGPEDATGSPSSARRSFDLAARVARVRDAMAGAWTRKDRAAYEAALADDVIVDEVAMPFEVSNKTQALELMAAYVAAMPDLAVTVDEAWAFGTTVAMAFTMKGTQAGRMFDLDATGKRLTVHGLDVVDTSGEKITRVRRYTNRLEWLSQMGLLGSGKASDEAGAKGAPPGEPPKPGATASPGEAPKRGATASPGTPPKASGRASPGKPAKPAR